MIPHIDYWLDVWANWSRGRSDNGLGSSNCSPEYRMMTENKDTTSKFKHRGSKHMLNVGTEQSRHFVQRDIEHMRCVESRGKYRESIPDNPVAEMMEDAVNHLRRPMFMDVILLKYKAQFGTPMCANLMSISKGAFLIMLGKIHESLDTYLRANHSTQVREIITVYSELFGEQEEVAEKEWQAEVGRFNADKAGLTEGEKAKLRVVLMIEGYTIELKKMDMSQKPQDDDKK